MGVRVGLGTIRLGRPWPPGRPGVLGDQDAERLVRHAVELGIRHFDTAPAYGESEQRLGRALNHVGRSEVTVATKFGESWSEFDGSRVDHSIQAARESIARSVDLLGAVDLLYIHKCTADLLADRSWLRQVGRLCDAAGIPALGASVSDLPSIAAAGTTEGIGYVQFPGNVTRPDLLEAARELCAGRGVDLNRPLAMGQAAARGLAACLAPVKATGARPLSGASSIAHLKEFVTAWQHA